MDPATEESMRSKIRREATPAACRRFGFTLLAGLPVAGLVWLVFLRLTTGAWIWLVPGGFAGAALLLGGGTLAAPRWGRPLYIGWHTVVRVIEWGLTWVLLFILFWVVITSVGLVRRQWSTAFRRGPAPGRKSYWQEVPSVKDPSRYYRQF